MQLPSLMYGTAWKEDATEELVVRALAAGFRAIDTANQRKHYNEEGVGRGIARAGIPRDQLFLQTKFTFRDGQDHRLPYDERAPIREQVAQSFESSLVHLGVTRVDSLVLHGPSQRGSLGPADHEAWRAMEALAAAGRVTHLGISNASPTHVAELIAFARIAPRFVQNRCYAERGWDRPVRALCTEHGLIYQGFSLLTANRQVVASRALAAIAKRHDATPAQIIFRFSQLLGMLPLTGTRDAAHMTQDLAAAQLALSPDEVATIEALS